MWVTAQAGVWGLPASLCLLGWMFSAVVCFCWWRAPGTLFGHQLMEKLNPKVRQGRERGWSEAGSMSTRWPQPHSRTWAVGGGKPNWKCGWSRSEEAL